MKSLSAALRFPAGISLLGLGVSPALCQVQSAAQPASAALSVKRIQNGAQLTAGDLNVKVQFYAEDIVHVLKRPAGGTSQKISLTVLQTDLPNLDVHFEENATGVTLTSANVRLRVSKSDGSIQYLDKDGRTVL